MLLIALLLATAPAPAFSASLSPATIAERTRLGQQQRARFERRMTQLAQAVERQRVAGLAEGRVAFMQQDIARVADGITRTLSVQRYLSPAEDRSYTAMLGQVARKLARAEAERMAPLALASRR